MNMDSDPSQFTFGSAQNEIRLKKYQAFRIGTQPFNV